MALVDWHMTINTHQKVEWVHKKTGIIIQSVFDSLGWREGWVFVYPNGEYVQKNIKDRKRASTYQEGIKIVENWMIEN